MSMNKIEESYNKEVDALPSQYDNGGGGVARYSSGIIYENLTSRICSELGLDAKKNDYKKSKKTKSGKQLKNLQVDWHVYRNNVLMYLVECKTYLDSCYLKRFIDDALDLHLSPEVPNDVKFAILAGQNACGLAAFEYNLEKFEDYTGKAIEVFFVNPLRKRNSQRGIYKSEYRRDFDLDMNVVNEFVEWLQN